MQSPLHSWSTRPRVITYINATLVLITFSSTIPSTRIYAPPKLNWASTYFEIYNIYNACPGSYRPNESAFLIMNSTPRGKVLLCGDFNLHHTLWDADCTRNDRIAEALVEWLATNGLSLLTGRYTPTRASSVIDLAIYTVALQTWFTQTLQYMSFSIVAATMKPR